MPHNQQAVEQTKRDCRYDEQIHRGDAVGMIAKERPPALGWRVSSLGHVLGHAGLSDIDAELEEFSMDPRRSPQRIGNAHLADKLAYLRRYSWPAATAPRLPPPVRSEPGAVPFNHGLRLHDRQGAQHLRGQTPIPKVSETEILQFLTAARATIAAVPVCWLATRSLEGGTNARAVSSSAGPPGSDEWTRRF